jgi:soluble lytic murein transglycosylase
MSGLLPRAIPLAAILLACLLFQPIVGAAAAQTKSPKRTHAVTKPKKKKVPSLASTQPESQLEQLARALHDESSTQRYERLAQFATQHAKEPDGTRAALALGYYDFIHRDYEAARKWLDKALADPFLGDYALYWRAQTDRAVGANDAALEEFSKFRRQYSASVMTDTAVEGLAQAALATGRPQVAVSALEDYSQTTALPSLILLRAQAREKVAAANGEKPFAATADYLDLVYRFPLSDEAMSAAYKIPILQSALGDQFPGTPLQTEIARAGAFYDARRWTDLRLAYTALLPKLSGVQHERATLRMAQAEAQSGRGPSVLASLQITDPALDAERLYTLSQSQRSAKSESDMLAATERLATQYPQSPWTEQALFDTGNYYWVLLDRSPAVEYYQRLLSSFPSGPNASSARWRITWTAYLGRQDDAVSLLEQYVQQYPTSSYVVDALYWLGRANERSANLARARSFYLAAVTRFPQTYFGERAEDRLGEIGREPTNSVEFLSVIPAPPPLVPISDPLPAAAQESWTRAQALRTIAFDNSAEQELRAAYTATRAPQLLLAVAQEAVAAGQFAAGITTVRQMVPQLEARRFDDIPVEVWRAGFPLPYREAVEREAQRNHVDPMLVAGLIRQESAFASDAVSYIGCCFGLMQMAPKTGAQLARKLRVQFSRSRLFDPDYNVKLGAFYISGLLASYPAPEFALAAYNAGETHVAEWTRGQKYEEVSEFVESIPVTQTRDYVQIVLRNAELYRQVYGTASASAKPSESPRP